MDVGIALLRSVNLGGHGKLPMRELVACLEALGLHDVATYVQSGNAVFRCPARELGGRRRADLASRIRTAIGERHGFEPVVVLLRLADLEAVVQDNPFPEAAAAPATLHVYFPAAPVRDPDLDGLENLRRSSERYRLTQRALYLHAPEGVARSRLAAGAERRLGVPATGRNWRSVTRILALAAERAS